MAKYREYETVLLKSGTIGSITDVYEPETYFIDVGTSPKDWDSIVVKEKDIERLATKSEAEEQYKKAIRELKEQGYL